MDFIFDRSLVLYLPLYQLDGASFISKDKHGHLCTVTGALWTPRGRSFDGVDDKIVLPTPAILDITGNVTLEVWVTTDSISANMDVVSGYDGTDLRFHLMFQTVNILNFYSGAAAGGNLASAPYSAHLGNWTHAVGIYDGDTKIYVNGEYVAKATTPLAPVTITTAIQLGERADGTVDFAGSIGEVRIYNRALTPPEIQHNYLATKWRYR